jgi:hypothetical protein
MAMEIETSLPEASTDETMTTDDQETTACR